MTDNLRIDFETHFYPKEYVSNLKHRKEFPRFVEDSISGLILEYDSKTRIPRQKLLARFSDTATRLQDMESAGIDMQVLSIPLPGVDKLDPASAVRLCRIANDEIAEICDRHKSKFVGFALLPIQAGEEAGEELRRAVTDLGLKGGFVHSNSNGNYLDSDGYLKILKLANSLDVPIFVHPTLPHDYHGMEAHRLARTFGLQFDLSLSILRLIFSSELESLPDLKLIVSHLGSTLPFIANRLDDEFQSANGIETRMSKKPSSDLKRLYVDTVTSDPRPLEFAKDFFGADHLLFGSDYPFWNTSLHVQAVKSSNLSSVEKESVFSRTARRLLKLS